MMGTGPDGKPFQIDEMMLAGIQRMMVLVHVNKKSTYPYALLKSFRQSRHPMLSSINKSHLYNILNYLEKQGYVRGKVSLVGSKAQKFYTVTASGRAKAAAFGKVFHKFVREASAIIRVL